MNLIRTRRTAMFTLAILACAPVASAASEKEECSKAYVSAQTQKLSHELLSARATLLVLHARVCTLHARADGARLYRLAGGCERAHSHRHLLCQHAVG